MSAHERTGWRDAALSDRHHKWGFDCPATDLDFLLVEYDHGKVRALVEYKHELAEPQYPNHPTYVAVKDLADRAGVPFLAVRYTGDFSRFICTPLNDLAKNYFPSGPENLSEVEFVAVLYAIRDRRIPFDLNQKLNS